MVYGFQYKFVPFFETRKWAKHRVSNLEAVLGASDSLRNNTMLLKKQLSGTILYQSLQVLCCGQEELLGHLR